MSCDIYRKLHALGNNRTTELHCNLSASCTCRRLQQRRVSEDCGVLWPQRGPLDLHCAHADSEGSIPDGCSHGKFYFSICISYLLTLMFWSRGASIRCLNRFQLSCAKRTRTYVVINLDNLMSVGPCSPKYISVNVRLMYHHLMTYHRVSCMWLEVQMDILMSWAAERGTTHMLMNGFKCQNWGQTAAMQVSPSTRI